MSFGFKLSSLLLQGILSKRTKPALQPNFAKEPSSPSHTKIEWMELKNNDNKY